MLVMKIHYIVNIPQCNLIRKICVKNLNDGKEYIISLNTLQKMYQ